MVEAFPYAAHTVLADNGMAFADLPKTRNGQPSDTSVPTIPGPNT